MPWFFNLASCDHHHPPTTRTRSLKYCYPLHNTTTTVADPITTGQGVGAEPICCSIVYSQSLIPPISLHHSVPPLSPHSHHHHNEALQAAAPSDPDTGQTVAGSLEVSDDEGIAAVVAAAVVDALSSQFQSQSNASTTSTCTNTTTTTHPPTPQMLLELDVRLPVKLLLNGAAECIVVDVAAA